MGRLRPDLRHTWRSIRARPAAMAGGLLVQAVGIGLVAAVFGLADPFVLRPLPYPESNQLVHVSVQAVGRLTPATISQIRPARPLHVADWAQRTDVFRSIAAYRRRGTIRVRLPGGATLFRVAEATPAFFDTVGVPAPGWAAAVHAGQADATPLVLTADAFRRAFGAQPTADVVGRTLPTDDGGAIRVVAVLPDRFVFPSDFLLHRSDALTPATSDMPVDGATVIARVAPGMTPAGIEPALSATAPQGSIVAAEPLRAYLAHSATRLALIALAAGAFIVLICAASLGGLSVARSVFRAGELATRQALGASRRDFARLLLVESALTTIPAVATGLVLGAVALALSSRVLPMEFAPLGNPAMTARGVTCAGATGVFLLVAQFLPAWASWRWLLARTVAHQASERRLRSARLALMVTESALVMVLLVGAAFLGRSYLYLVGQDTGFSGDVLAVEVSYPETDSRAALQADIDRTIASLHGVIGVASAAASQGPLVNHVIAQDLTVINGTVVPATTELVTPDYFEAVGSPILYGRALTAQDGKTAVVVSESLARREFASASSAVGRPAGRNAQIVGVVRDTFNVALDQPPEPTVYYLLHDPPPCHGADCNRVTYVLRLTDGAPDVGPAVRRAALGVNSDAIVEDESSLSERLGQSVADRTFATLILSFFATAGIIIAAGGLVAMVAFVVARRTREVAIRMALGAPRAHVVRVVIAEAAWATSTGIVSGLVLGAIGSRTLEHLLYGVSPGDWSTLAGAAAFMLAASMVATLMPARRALAIAPSVALRAE
jgi:putative ABC transport system permease protein